MPDWSIPGWTDPSISTSNYEVKNDYLEYYNQNYTSVLDGYVGRLPPGTVFNGSYDPKTKYITIINCSLEQAVGKCIKSTKNASGVEVLFVTTNKPTTEAKATVDPGTGLKVPENTDKSGTAYYSPITGLSLTMDSSFVENEYSKIYKSYDDYYNKLKKGLRVKDLRAILGMPHQFLPTADPRIDNNDIGENDMFGRVYSERIVKQIPLLLMTPGIPVFMQSYSKSQREKIIGKLAGFTDEAFNSILGDTSGKYYSLKYAYTEYFHYVNAMLRSAAHFLDIQDEKIDNTPLGKLGTRNWLYTTSNIGSDIFSHGNLSNFLGPYAGCIAFYADAGTSVDESFGNSTQESELASTVDTLSGKAREFNFIAGNIGGALSIDGIGNLDIAIDNLTSQVKELFGGSHSVLGNILGKGRTLLAGGRLLFPEIWSDSSFSRSYSCSMKLISPSGDKLSIFLNILVPIYHLLAFTLPRQSGVEQAYYSPFLVRAYYKGLFNVDMGIISGLSISKGDEGEWTIDGIPTVANVSFEIKDLYDGLYMSKQTMDKDLNIMSNIQELDYIANSCGININDQEIMRTVRMYAALGFTNITDKVTIDIFGGVSQYFNQKMQKLFGKFK